MSATISDFWKQPVTIARNNFVNKSLSSWSLNIAVGCSHGCRFCYVPDVSTIKLGPTLAKFGVGDPDEQWGDYVFLRPWQEPTFLASLRRAEATPLADLNADGNRAVMLCTTTDPYMVIRHPEAQRQRELNAARRQTVRDALTAILTESTLNVRILTRSPLAREDFHLMRRFGNRLLFGMSLPTLDARLARVYEPNAPAPERRLETLRDAKAAGIPVYVAMAPTFPEESLIDLERTFAAIAALDPVTIFHEPINIRADNVARIEAHAKKLGVEMRSEVFATPERWAHYSISQLAFVEGLAERYGCADRLHLWPDAALKKWMDAEWLAKWWGRVSAWPGKVTS